jgi:hypothetical protein
MVEEKAGKEKGRLQFLEVLDDASWGGSVTDAARNHD